MRNIKEYVKSQKEQVREEVAALSYSPQLAIVQVGNNEASNRYVANKVKDCGDVGIKAHCYYFEEKIQEDDLVSEILEIQKWYDGIIVQLPLPAHINNERIKKIIEENKDVDGFHPLSWFDPCTPKGIMDYLRDSDFEVEGKSVVIIGRSDIVGKPLAKMMTDANATVTLCHSKTKNLWKHIDNADLIVCAVGKANFLNCYSIHVPVIDVGINFVDGKLVGDCFNTENKEVTPVPGGVGLLTRLALLKNVVKAAKMRRERFS